jgi:hypothetical protein
MPVLAGQRIFTVAARPGATVALPYIEKKSGVVASGHIKVFDGSA